MAAEADIDIIGWDIAFYGEYERSSYHYGEFRTPLVAAVHEEIERQKSCLREVGELAMSRGRPRITEGKRKHATVLALERSYDTVHWPGS
ncbi:MAG TPA: hypothetical protein VE733_01070 [Streptosporangiaceae bacterium]|nr:hypothetical protein [Streptosporangiaceae bacterium]